MCVVIGALVWGGRGSKKERLSSPLSRLTALLSGTVYNRTVLSSACPPIELTRVQEREENSVKLRMGDK